LQTQPAILIVQQVLTRPVSTKHASQVVIRDYFGDTTGTEFFLIPDGNRIILEGVARSAITQEDFIR